MEKPLTFSVGSNCEITVANFSELEEWLQKEREQWEWLVPGDGRTDRHDVAAAIQNTWNRINSDVAVIKSQDQPLEAVLDCLAPLTSAPLLISTTSIGANVLDIRRTVGDQPASFAAGFATSQLNMSNAQNKDDLLGALLTVFPDLRDAASWSENLKRERAAYRGQLTKTIAEVKRKTSHQQDETKQLVSRASEAARRILNQKRKKWQEVQLEWQADANAAVVEIQNTEKSYKEFMKLKAPVQYWQEKAKKHETKEKTALLRLYWYFPLTIMIMAAVFAGAAFFLINHPDTDSNKSPIALYFVISGGLLLLSTLAFWIGRLLTKLYLSEHHLRNDAEERAVMATTYLALTNEGEAKDEDRHIVLAALFRGTPDGIVKDEGPSDASIQGLLTKLLAR